MVGWNLLILLLLSVGHAELMVTLVNRVHSYPIPRATLRRFRHLDDLMIFAFPLALLLFLGLTGPRLLRGGSWADVHPLWFLYLPVCALGLCGFLFSVMRWWSRSAPRPLRSNHSELVDIAGRLGYRPLGKGKFRYLARFPGNEIFSVQVNEKQLALPRLPKEWDRLSILHLTDTHFIGTVERAYFEEVCKIGAAMQPDIVVFTGDLLDDEQLVSWLGDTLDRIPARLGRYYILGNHDWFFGPEPIRVEFNRRGWTPVAGRTVTLDHHGHRLEIGGTEAPWMGDHPQWSDAASDFRLLLSHTPDHFAWAQAQQVDLMLAGHNHGGQVVLPVIGPVFSPSRFGVRFASGTFWSEPTLMHVSRGLSGRHPLRLNCPPELTKLVLCSPDVHEARGAK